MSYESHGISNFPQLQRLMEASHSKQLAVRHCEGLDLTSRVKESHSYMVLSLFTALVCTLFSVIAVPHMVLSFPGVSLDPDGEGTVFEEVSLPLRRPSREVCRPRVQAPSGGSWSFPPPPPPVDGRKGV